MAFLQINFFSCRIENNDFRKVSKSNLAAAHFKIQEILTNFNTLDIFAEPFKDWKLIADSQLTLSKCEFEVI